MLRDTSERYVTTYSFASLRPSWSKIPARSADEPASENEPPVPVAISFSAAGRKVLECSPTVNIRT